MIYILLVTYNGERYFFEQIESLLSQSYKNWKIWIHDDASKDNTVKIIKDYVNKYPEKIVFLDDDISCGGAKENFTYLLNNIDKNFDYIMFCDQDDVWNNDKIEKTFEKMQELENLYGDNIPLLVHTNLEVVNEKLETLSSSFWKHEQINPECNSLNNLLMQNTVTGCTMMINRKLAELSLPISNDCMMHDCWIALVASSFGRIGYITEPTIKYRQHSSNSVGAKGFSSLTIIKRVFIKKYKLSVSRNIIQAKAFLENFEKLLDKTTKDMLKEFTNIENKSFFEKRKFLLKNKILKQGLIRNIGLLLII